MPTAGDIALIRFPHADLQPGKLRPVLLLAQPPGRHGDWLVCMVSSRLGQEVPGFDECIAAEDGDFGSSGLHLPSLVRLGRLAVLEDSLFTGALGRVGAERLQRLLARLAAWLDAASR